MDFALLKQVEELVLHMIDQEKRINVLNEENIRIKRLVKQLSETVTHCTDVSRQQ